MPPLRLLLLLLVPLTAGASTPPTDLLYGHYELHVDYAVSPGNPDAGWRFSVSYDEDDDFSTSAGVVRLDPARTVIVATPRCGTRVPSPAGAFARFGPAGTPLWVMPQNQLTGTPFLGVRTTMGPGLFQARVGNQYSPSSQGSVALRLISVEGTGPDAGGKFATWKTESFGSTIFSFDSTDGIGASDEIPTIPVSSHTHYNWAFTRPGLYRVTLEAQGKLMPTHGGAITTARQTFLFAVPFSSRISGDGGGQLRLTGGDGMPPGVIPADSPNGVAYAPDRVMMETVAATAASSSVPGTLWESRLLVSPLPASLPNGVGIDPVSASAGLAEGEWQGLTWNVTAVRGPGNVTLIGPDGTAGNSVPLSPDGTTSIVVAFGSGGIHRVTGTLSGVKDGAPFTNEPTTLVFGAGVTAEHGYAVWQTSFEAMAGLQAGALADPAGDHDQDGIPNAAEFALFWHGLDPTIPDAWRMPRARQSAAGHATFDFLRDTFKDPLDESSWQIRAAHSSDLSVWRLRSSRVPGFPLGLFETGAERGNAYGRIFQRQLRLIPAPQRGAFFRFEISPP